MIIPKRLEKGMKVGLVCCSGAMPEERKEATLKSIEALGLKYELGESAMSRYGYLGGTDAVRAADINRFFADNSIDGVFALRGGYGAQRVLDMIDFDMIKENPKIFAGYSDVTALHTHITQYCGFVTYHSPMHSTEFYKINDQYTLDSYYENLFTDNMPSLDNAYGAELKMLVGGKAEGELAGGNLTLLASSLGTPYEFDSKGKILFIEDIGEEPYRLDRYFTQLRLAGKFEECAGIIFGYFIDCEQENKEKPGLSIMQIIEDIVLTARKPTVIGFSCGHSVPSLTLPLGRKVSLDADNLKIKLV